MMYSLATNEQFLRTSAISFSILKIFKQFYILFLVSNFHQKISGIRILWWKRAYKSPFSKFLISVEKSTPKLSVMS